MTFYMVREGRREKRERERGRGKGVAGRGEGGNEERWW